MSILDPKPPTRAELSATYGSAADTGYDIVLLVGQSNMAGRGAAYNAFQDPIDSKVWQFGNRDAYANQISIATEPLDQNETSTSGMGPGLVFARWYAAGLPIGRRVLLVPAARGGTPLVGAWEKDSYLYTEAITQTNKAIAAAGPNARVTAILWLQGETDGDNLTTGATYQTKFDAMIDGFRAAFGNPNLPFVLGQMVPEYQTAGTRRELNAVHIATPSRKTKVAFAPSPLGLNNADSNHFNADAQRIIGRNMFDAYRRIVTGAAEPSIPAVPGAVTGLAASNVSSAAMTLNWAATTGAARYTVERKLTSGGTWAIVADLAATTLLQSGLAVSTSYDYRVSAINQGGAGVASAVLTQSTTALLAPPQVTGLTAGTASSTAIPLTWNAATDAASYKVEYRVSPAGSWTNGPTPTATNATVSGLTASTAYDFRVSGVNSTGTGPASTVVTKSTGAAIIGFTDNFNRANATTLGNTSGTESKPWEIIGGGTWSIASNAAVLSTAATADSFAVVDANSANGTFTTTLKTVGNRTGGLGVRVQDYDNNITVNARVSGSDAHYRLLKKVGGTTTALATATTATSADGDIVAVTTSGSSIIVKVNGVEIFNTTVTDMQTATKFGLYASNFAVGNLVWEDVSFV